MMLVDNILLLLTDNFNMISNFFIVFSENKFIFYIVKIQSIYIKIKKHYIYWCITIIIDKIIFCFINEKLLELSVFI